MSVIKLGMGLKMYIQKSARNERVQEDYLTNTQQM